MINFHHLPHHSTLSSVITIIKHIKLHKTKWSKLGQVMFRIKYCTYFAKIHPLATLKVFSSLLSLKCLKSFIKWTKLCLSSIWLQNFNWFLNFSTLDGEWGGGGRTCLCFSHEFLKLHHRMIVNTDHAKHETNRIRFPYLLPRVEA